jgi:multidrug efflux pump subunit AcrA (membrane-fusion protein)
VIVPADAVIGQGPDRGVVFVLKEGQLERRAVRLGPAEPKGQVIQGGVSPGETVAVGGLEKLKDGERVRINKKPPNDEGDEQ